MGRSNIQLVSAAITDKGLSVKRPVNEDSYLEMAERGLFAVADGVGGAQAGDFASQMAIEVLQEAFSHPKLSVDAEELLEMAIQRANESIYQMSLELPQFEMMATTVIALYLSGDVATIGHVGDSRLYRLDADGNLFRETQDHSIVEEEVRAGRMTIAQAANHPSRNVISRALGANNLVDVEMRTIMFELGTTFLLCSDGLTRHVSDYEIKEILKQHESLHDACQHFKSLCYSRGAEDNLTVVIIRVEEAGVPSAGTSDEENTVTKGGRSFFARNPLATLSSNGNQRGASATNVWIEEHAAIPNAAPDVGTAPLEVLPSSINKTSNDPQIAETNLTLSSQQNDQTLIDSARIDFGEPKRQALTNDLQVDNQDNSNDAETFSSFYDEEKSNDSSAKLLALLPSLLAGAFIGGILVYALTALTSSPVTPANIAPAQTAQIVPPQTAVATNDFSAQEINEFRNFERVRRNVDKQPQSVQMALQQPETAADYYLLGRAFLQTGNYDKARESLKKAAELVSQSNEVSADTLRVDITTAQAALGAMSHTYSDRSPLRELIKSKQSNSTNAAQPSAAAVNR